ncbi:hypothetical protein OE88DRAFT_1660463 [Heliocybe sulcata]|uniref:WD40 repeat-like protein n=1 Tax=Heliocybe sulcata TaxID=5364 RepID=A0A5C3NB98_9AGAM|nr:hypothetical protein OE88DRAFT_1660463 [Heliocybe sulcata]
MRRNGYTIPYPRAGALSELATEELKRKALHAHRLESNLQSDHSRILGSVTETDCKTPESDLKILYIIPGTPLVVLHSRRRGLNVTLWDTDRSVSFNSVSIDSSLVCQSDTAYEEHGKHTMAVLTVDDDDDNMDKLYVLCCDYSEDPPQLSILWERSDDHFVAVSVYKDLLVWVQDDSTTLNVVAVNMKTGATASGILPEPDFDSVSLHVHCDHLYIFVPRNTPLGTVFELPVYHCPASTLPYGKASGQRLGGLSPVGGYLIDWPGELCGLDWRCVFVISPVRGLLLSLIGNGFVGDGRYRTAVAYLGAQHCDDAEPCLQFPVDVCTAHAEESSPLMGSSLSGRHMAIFQRSGHIGSTCLYLRLLNFDQELRRPVLREGEVSYPIIESPYSIRSIAFDDCRGVVLLLNQNGTICSIPYA